MRTLRLALALALSFPTCWPAWAAGQDVSGSWNVTWAQAVRNNPDGSLEIQKWGEALLVLRQDREHLSGAWTTSVVGQVTWKVEGTVRAGLISLSSSEHDSADPQLAAVQEMRWRGALTNDRLEGEMTLVFRGAARAPSWRPWRAVRAGPG